LSNPKKINNPTPVRVLVAPLEWGLGHATRCIPIIKELLHHKCEVFVAAEGKIFELLKIEFPEINFLLLKGYRVKLSKKSFLFWKMTNQLPAIVARIYQENRWLHKTIKQYMIDGVISDNRFGLYNKRLPCIYITHQLLIKTGHHFIDKMAQQVHYYFISKYYQCWVPDFEKNGLAGELSHPRKIPKSVKYIGTLSRFNKEKETQEIYDLLIILSGPEPQRTIFEKKILQQLLNYNESSIFVRGLPGINQTIQLKNSSIKIVNHLVGEELGKLMQQAKIIVSRSGYTTIMDLLKLNKTAILVPTPGQTEQEYLADFLMRKKIFFCVGQKDFDLKEAITKYQEFPFVFPNFNMQQYKAAVNEFLAIFK
jgi:uncharacterized protein (TIGR00661 family)